MESLNIFPSKSEPALKNCYMDGAKHGKEQLHQQAWGPGTWLSSGMGKSLVNVEAAFDRNVSHTCPFWRETPVTCFIKVACVDDLHILPMVFVIIITRCVQNQRLGRRGIFIDFPQVCLRSQSWNI
jgi:hypothetical protein